MGSPAEKISKVSAENDDTLADSAPSDWSFERLKQVLSETVLTKKREGCVELLQKVLVSGSPSVTLVYPSPQLVWIPAMESREQGLKRVDLEVRNAAMGKRMNIFSGYGATDAAAKDHVAWEALKFLYVFGGFAA